MSCLQMPLTSFRQPLFLGEVAPSPKLHFCLHSSTRITRCSFQPQRSDHTWSTPLLHSSRPSCQRAEAAAWSAPDKEPTSPESTTTKIREFLAAFWKFLRPHTIRGTILGSVAVTVRALLENPSFIDVSLVPRALLGVLALLCGNGYIVGINQIYDVEIDEVNKPFLPIAAKKLSPLAAWILVCTLAASGLTITSLNFGKLVTSLYSIGLFLGTIYSIPPFRLKKFAVPSFLIIATVRGFLLNFGVYYSTRAALGLPFAWSPAIIFITCFVTIYASAIAVTKDLADVKGDVKFNINTFASRLGIRNLAILGTGLLLLNYCAAIALAVNAPTEFKTKIMVSCHAVFALKLLYEGGKLDAGRYTRAAIQRYYAWIWNLFYAEYILLPLI